MNHLPMPLTKIPFNRFVLSFLNKRPMSVQQVIFQVQCSKVGFYEERLKAA